MAFRCIRPIENSKPIEQRYVQSSADIIMMNEIGMMARKILNLAKMLKKPAPAINWQCLKEIDDVQIDQKPELHGPSV